MSDAKKQLQIEKDMWSMGEAIKEMVEAVCPGFGFALLLFAFNDPRVGNYISSGKREDIILALRETADRLEARQDLPPAGTIVQ